jgi:O-antigen/teichoic acid export membrane protein
MRRLLPRSRFLRRLAMLSGGTFLGQLMLVASSPVLTRLYGPEAFGTLAVFASVSAILGMVAALRYEFAVPVARGEAEAAGLVRVGAAASVLVSVLAALGVWAGGDRLEAAAATPGLAALLWLLPPAVLLNGLALPLGHWSIRQGTFRVNTLNRLVQSAGQVVPQLLLGLLGAGAAGLVLGYAAGYLARLLHLLGALAPAERAALRGAARWRDAWPLARRHWHYPAYAAPAALLESGAQLLPAVLLAILYGPAVAGWFGLGQRVVGLPVKLVAQAASQVFLGEAPGLADAAAVRRLFARSALAFAAAGAVGMGPLLLFGPALFALAFGEPWREAGALAALLVPQHLARFVVMPVSQTLNLYGRQDLHLWASLIGALATAAAFGAAARLGLGPAAAVALYSAGTTAAFLVHLWFTWRVARRGILPPPPDA